METAPPPTDEDFYEAGEEEDEGIVFSDVPIKGRKPKKRKGPQPPRVAWVRPDVRPPLEPVTFRHTLLHDFKKRPNGKMGCAVEGCGLYKNNPVHHAYPASFNAGGSSRNAGGWQGEKKTFMALFDEYLLKSGLPKGLGKVMVEGTLCFPTRRMRRGPDQGNYRHPIEKHLGDALVDGGWLKDDNWLMYEFGHLRWTYEKDVRWMEITILPDWDSPDLPPEAGGATLF